MIDIDYYRLLSVIGLSINYVWSNLAEATKMSVRKRRKEEVRGKL